jgi:hypothetical protein
MIMEDNNDLTFNISDSGERKKIYAFAAVAPEVRFMRTKRNKNGSVPFAIVPTIQNINQ